jgi:hypothetical protein
MIRNLIVLLLFLFGIFFAGLYLGYATMDPCRALAVEEARRSPAPTTIAKLWTRIETSGMSRVSCSRALVLSWRERLER